MKRNRRKISIRFRPDKPAIKVFRSRPKAKRVVYILQANQRVKLRHGNLRSRIIYIGESGKKGLGRPATSAYRKADDAFGTKGLEKKRRGVSQIDVHLLTFRGMQRLKVWKQLERALIAMFREMNEDNVPFYNKKGRGEGYTTDKITLFSKDRLRGIIDELS